ncbi:MAG: MBL fold metallo-hydrolase [bacterium]|nr:MBL fold metallo-hydrolase [bacterium]
MPGTSSTRRIVFLACGVLILLGGIGFWSSREPTTLRVWFADVGQGDGTIIRTPSRETIIVDGGKQNDFLREVDDHVPVTDRTIDLVVVTHADADHVTGLTNLIASGRVQAVLMNRDATVKTKTYARLLAAIDDQHVPVLEAQAGQVFDYGDVRLRVLWPTALGLKSAKTTNERSVVVKISFGSQDMLLTGDAPDTVEQQVLKQGSDVAAEVLKVGHHGSGHSSTLAFLQAVQPTLGVISVGAKNNYGHPAKRVLNDLQRVGARVERTDHLGDILVLCTITVCIPSVDH